MQLIKKRAIPFILKISLIEHYKITLGATHIGGHKWNSQKI
jgi:hypothetical protein